MECSGPGWAQGCLGRLELQHLKCMQILLNISKTCFCFYFTFCELISISLPFSIFVCSPGFPWPPFCERKNWQMKYYFQEKRHNLPKIELVSGLFSTFGFTQQSSFSWKNAPNYKINQIDQYLQSTPCSPVCSCCHRTPGRPRTPRPRHSHPRPPRRAQPWCSTDPGQPPARRSEMLTIMNN